MKVVKSLRVKPEAVAPVHDASGGEVGRAEVRAERVRSRMLEAYMVFD